MEKNAVFLNHNDLFVVAPAVTSFFLILIGTTRSVPALIGIGAGMALYGISYLLFHEMLVHKRFTKSLRPKNPVLQKLVQAHLTHHASTTKDGCVNFGFFVPDPLAALKALKRINLFR